MSPGCKYSNCWLAKATSPTRLGSRRVSQAARLSTSVPSWHRLSGMNTKMHGRREEIRYSEAFKMEVVRELEMGGLAFEDIAMKYGIKGKGTVSRWVRQYGNGTRGKVIRVERPGEINELKRLKARVRQLESALADANIDAALERAYTRLACQRAGITDVAGFKKKAAGQPGMKP